MPTFLRFLQIFGLDLFRILKNHGNPTLSEVVAEVERVLFGEPAIMPFDGKEGFVVLALPEALCSPAVPAGLESLFGVVVVHELLERIANVGDENFIGHDCNFLCRILSLQMDET